MKIRQRFALSGIALTVGAFASASAQNIVTEQYTVTGTIIDYEVDTYGILSDIPFTLRLDAICDELPEFGRPLDPVVEVYDAATDTLLASDNDSGSVACNGGGSSALTINLEPGEYEVDIFDVALINNEVAPLIVNAPYTLIFTYTYDADLGAPPAAGIAPNPLERDGRLNPDAQATAVLYCDAASGVTQVYTISGTSGTFAFSFTSDEATNAVTGDIIGSGSGATVEKLADGRLLLRSPMSGGKNYLFVWNGCPFTRGETYSEDFNFGAPVRSGSRG